MSTTTASEGTFPEQLRWESDGTSRIPFMAYTDAELHKKELPSFSNRWCRESITS